MRTPLILGNPGAIDIGQLTLRHPARTARLTIKREGADTYHRIEAGCPIEPSFAEIAMKGLCVDAGRRMVDVIKYRFEIKVPLVVGGVPVEFDGVLDVLLGRHALVEGPHGLMPFVLLEVESKPDDPYDLTRVDSSRVVRWPKWVGPDVSENEDFSMRAIAKRDRPPSVARLLAPNTTLNL